jgi:hypothetical protein
MPPFAEPGFTSPLRETLLLSRSKLDEWVEHEKAKADALCEKSRQVCFSRQQRLDTTITNLLALQIQGGMTIVADDGNKSASNKDSSNQRAKKTEILEQQDAARREMEQLQAKLADEKARIDGTFASLPFPGQNHCCDYLFTISVSLSTRTPYGQDSPQGPGQGNS